MKEQEHDLQEQLWLAAHRVAACPHVGVCGDEFRIIGRQRGEARVFADVPSPDFIGSRYRGLVIIAGNPGLAHKSVHQHNDRKMFGLQRRIALGDRAAFHDLMAFLPSSMASWPQMVDERGRKLMDYEIEEIAYVELVKCGTRPGSGNTASLFKGTGVLQRCWAEHTSPILELLQPTHIVFQWSPLAGVLSRLGYSPQLPSGSYNGARHLSLDKRYAGVRPIFDLYYRRTPAS